MKTAPDPKDIQEFQFKQSSVCQLVEPFTSIPASCSLIVADKTRGLVYAGYSNKLIVLKPGEDNDPEWKIELALPILVCKIGLSCNCAYLAVATNKPLVFIYDVQALSRNSIHLLQELQVSLTTPDSYVVDLKWNPTIPGMLCTIASDYTIGNFQVKNEKEGAAAQDVVKKIMGLDVLCAAWSPKGKQIVVGCKDGNIVQLKPDLKVARTIGGPAPNIGEIISILWISNYQFCTAYLSTDQQVNVLIVDAPKGEANGIFTCYEDITYGTPDADGEGGVLRYYFDHVPEWGVIIAASSRSSEIAMLGSTDSGVTWNHWQLVDCGRAQLPLVCTSESYPMGMCIDKSSVRILPWGADSTLPHPVPILHILGTSGQLCSFHMVNLTENAPAINSPPTEIVPAPVQQKPNTVSFDTSAIMNSAVATSTPRPKTFENIADRQKALPKTNIFADYNKNPGFFASPPEMEKPQPPPPPQEQKPIQVAPPEPVVRVDPPKEVRVPEPVKIEMKPAAVKEAPPPEVNEQKIIIDESICVRAYLEEVSLFEKELKSKMEPNTWECGTEEERKQLAERAAIIDQFLRDLRETTTSLSSEIAYLKALLLQSFAWVEETKSKNAASHNIVTRNCGDVSKISELQRLYYYTQTQLTQATKILDLEWSEHKAQEKSRMRIPSLEFVYQNLVLHNKIISKEKTKLEQLKKRWKSVTRATNITGLNNSMTSLHITSPKSTSSLRGNTSVIDAKCKTIASRTLSFTQEKQAKLRNLLSNNTPKVIKPVNPSPIQDRLEATLSSLASLSTRNSEIKKAELSAPKLITPNKPITEKPEQQNALDSLKNIVARIRSTETNGTPIQNVPQVKSPQNTLSFSTTPTKKFPQADKKQNPPVLTPAIPATKTKPKTTPVFGQLHPASTTMPNLTKNFSLVDTIPFGSAPPKPEEFLMSSNQFKETPSKPKEAVHGTDISKPETNFFSAGSLNEALTSVMPTAKPQDTILNTPQFTPSAVTGQLTTPKTDVASTFSFANAMNMPVAGKTTAPDAVLPPNAQAFCFASKTVLRMSLNAKPLSPTTTQPQTQGLQDLPSLLLGLQTTSTNATAVNNVSSTTTTVSSKPATTVPTDQGTSLTFNGLTVSLVNGSNQKSSVPTSSTVTIEEISTPETTASPFGSPPAQTLSSTASPTSVFGGPSTALNTRLFGGNSSTGATAATFTTPACTSMTTTFATPPVTTMVSMFGGFSNATSTVSSSATTTSATSSVAPPLFSNTLPKSTFEGSAVSSSAPGFTGVITTTTATMSFSNFKTTAASSIFSKSNTPPLATTSQFSTTTSTSSPSNAFDKTANTSGTMPFGGFSADSTTFNMPTANFGKSWMFGGTQAGSNTTANSGSIFGASTPASSASSIFGGTAPPMNTFGTPSTGSVFGNNSQKPGPFSGSNSGTTSVFGGNTSTPGTAATASVFNTSPTNSSVFGQQPGFGQPSTFSVKPQNSMFGGGAVFGSALGNPLFGGNTNAPAFGGPPNLAVTPAPMDNKIFGSGSGSNTFETLGSQSGGLSFSSLAQKSPEPEKTPAFGGGSSFSSWR